MLLIGFSTFLFHWCLLSRISPTELQALIALHAAFGGWRFFVPSCFQNFWPNVGCEVLEDLSMPKLAVWQAAKHSAVKCWPKRGRAVSSFRKPCTPSTAIQYSRLWPSATSASRNCPADHAPSAGSGHSLFKGKVNHVAWATFDRCRWSWFSS